MDSFSKNHLQCQSCGSIFSVDREYHYELVYVASYCPKCNATKRCLNLGNSYDDIYLYYNVNLDRRQYNNK